MRLVAIALTVVGVAVATPASAYDWTVTLGIEGSVMPSYLGSDEYVLRPTPLFDIRRAGPRRFSGTRDGASIGLFEGSNFRAGLTGKIVRPRDQDDDAALRGLGDVDWTLEVGAFAEYWPVQWFRARAAVRQGFGGHDGIVGDLSGDIVVPITPQLTLSGGPRLTLATADALDPYFSITPAQSVASGLPVYSASGGVRSWGAGALARYEFSPQWATHVFIEYERLTDSAANSPLVSLRGSPDQVEVGIGLTYSFDVSLFSGSRVAP
jgi:outer membrane protein